MKSIRFNTLLWITALVVCSGALLSMPTAAQAEGCAIWNSLKICPGGETKLCSPFGMASYSWSGPDGFISDERCIIVTEPGLYTLTTVSVSGVESTCEGRVVELDAPVCEISGVPEVCAGSTTELCAPEGAAGYAWVGPNGFLADTRCITVSDPGFYELTVTSDEGCSQSCEIEVTDGSPVPCEITGNRSICDGESTELCGPDGADSYSWSGPNGFSAESQCITVSEAGDYSLLVNAGSKCASSCTATVSVDPGTACVIKGDLLICEGESTELCGPNGAASYAWMGPNGFAADSQCITVSEAGEYTLKLNAGSACETRCKVSLETEPCGGMNCPRTVGFWGQQCDQKNNGSTKFTVEQVTAIAERVDESSDFFDWPEGEAFDRFCAMINPPRPMDQRRQLKRQYAALLANAATGELGLITNNGEEIMLDLSTPFDCGDASSIGGLVDAIEQTLADYEGMSLDDDDVATAYSSVQECADDVNNGRGLVNKCGEEEEEDGEDDESARVGDRGFSSIRGANDTSIGEGTLLRLAPNPFSGSTTFRFAVSGPEAVSVKIAIYDAAGRKVRTLVSGERGPGEYQVMWDGRESSGRQVARGVYYARALIGSQSAVSRVLYLR